LNGEGGIREKLKVIRFNSENSFRIEIPRHCISRVLGCNLIQLVEEGSQNRVIHKSITNKNWRPHNTTRPILITISYTCISIHSKHIKRGEEIPKSTLLTPLIMLKGDGGTNTHSKGNKRKKSTPPLVNEPPQTLTISSFGSRRIPTKTIVTIFTANHPSP